MKTDQRPNDGVLFMERVLIAVAIGVILGLFAIVCSMDFSDALVAEAMEKEARPARAAAPILDHPLRYDATITQSGDGIKQPRTRYYVHPSKR